VASISNPVGGMVLMKHIPTVIREMKIKWFPEPGIYRINVQTFGQKPGFQFQSLPEMLGKNLKNTVTYLEGRTMFLDLPIRKLP